VLIGYRSRDIKTNKAGDDMGFGAGLFSHVSLYGDDFLHFRKELKNLLKYSKKRSRIPKIKKQDAKNIEKIEFACPIGAIKKTEQGYMIDKKSCFGCMLCVELLPDIFEI
jgi:ferredoxin